MLKYTSFKSLFGIVHIAVTDKGVCMLDLNVDESKFKKTLEARFRRIAEKDDKALQTVAKHVSRYLQGEKTSFTGPIDLRGTPFQLKVWRHLQSIPYGKAETYREVAQAIGTPNAYRAVGNACGANPVPLMVPCHRVLASGNKIGGYGLGPEVKKKLLEIEGHKNIKIR
ncbi:MAG: methylated-DNA--[protein]-cysteine S-methyltransferase [Thaumarchaeota archaeon]|nr:methylated-DNA--[protein]-cysteine S-methyltransferase [Nitrososphaerota archaeon]